MGALGNFLGYQAVWFLAVYGAGAQRTSPALCAAGVFAAWQLAYTAEVRADLRLIGTALVCGVLIDGSLARSGLVRYAAPAPALPPHGAPLWILALWTAFALTFNHSLRWLAKRPAAAALLGAVGGPLAYLSASRLAGAVQLSQPAWRGITALAVGWSVALALLAWRAVPAAAAGPPARAAL
jgi:hypothetical protein